MYKIQYISGSLHGVNEAIATELWGLMS